MHKRFLHIFLLGRKKLYIIYTVWYDIYSIILYICVYMCVCIHKGCYCHTVHFTGTIVCPASCPFPLLIVLKGLHQQHCNWLSHYFRSNITEQHEMCKNTFSVFSFFTEPAVRSASFKLKRSTHLWLRSELNHSHALWNAATLGVAKSKQNHTKKRKIKMQSSIKAISFFFFLLIISHSKD